MGDDNSSTVFNGGIGDVDNCSDDINGKGGKRCLFIIAIFCCALVVVSFSYIIGLLPQS